MDTMTRDGVEAVIDRSPDLCGGAAVIAGTRIAVHDIVGYYRVYGGEIERLLDEFPHLSREQVEAAMEYARLHALEIEGLLQRRREAQAEITALGSAF
jgi:uncharacterized protein (DUF433 family)